MRNSMTTRVFHGSSSYPSPSPNPVVTVGNFDGVHLGHRSLLAATKHRALKEGVPACVYTFDPSPVQVLRPDLAPQRLQRIEDRVDALLAFGMDQVVIEPFTRDLGAMSAEAFASNVLLAHLNPTAMIVGWDFRFGHGRQVKCGGKCNDPEDHHGDERRFTGRLGLRRHCAHRCIPERDGGREEQRN